MLDVIIAIMMKIRQMIIYIYIIFTKEEKEGQEMKAKGKKCS